VDAIRVAVGGGQWLVSGSTDVQKLKEELGMDHLPQEDEGHYDTLAGLVLALASPWLASSLPDGTLNAAELTPSLQPELNWSFPLPP